MTDASSGKNETIDPIALSVIWNGLLSIAEEVGSTLRCTAYSEAVREAQDFSTGIFDRHARLIAQGNFSPGHLGSMPYVVKSVLEYHPPESLKPGDGILVNDSLLGSGHFPDCFLITPAFMDGEIIGYIVNIAHQIDVGGAAPGSQKVLGVTESFQEGLRILPVRVVRDGDFDPDMLRLILGNIRVPDKVRGDFRAQLNANTTGAARFVEFFESYGADQLERAFDAILDRSEARIRDVLRGVPNGTYSFEDHMDDYGVDTPPIRIAVDIIVEDDQITVDYSRSSEQVPAAINSYINYTRAYTLFAVKVFLDPMLPQNAGGIRPIITRAREGSFFNPAFPAPSGGRAALQIRMFDAINGAFAKVLPEKAMGAFSHWCNPNLGGLDDETGESFVVYDLIFAGYGGRAHCDGVEALSPVMNCANIPIEVQETQNPDPHPPLRNDPGFSRRGEIPGRLRRPQGCGAAEQHGNLVLAQRPASIPALRHLRRRTGPIGRDDPQSGRLCRTAGFQGNAGNYAWRRGQLPIGRRRRVRGSGGARSRRRARGCRRRLCQQGCRGRNLRCGRRMRLWLLC